MMNDRQPLDYAEEPPTIGERPDYVRRARVLGWALLGLALAGALVWAL
jgi:hypothetical protein